ncbi:MAG: flagellar type III secretion system protein FlhB [Gammaproteobacteria bacterium]|jgi:flagellar biosynthetic protein FlhB|nr:flagellar type III secretion system protein FlhB [Gammaproteobacteria bacterium]MBP6052161.1 flagellar type III secretion system protein FlhB [Pseudomonadales bacterium]MBK6582223.1 flagellar type III secretion system protein FlhB [Gammaproteobacteria bacterium]MBK7521504.1 flagellar type III secretion system protein FlhB [Gammaproteobacteria bacterium]MBK7729278.1 flagellar type III secretion system protein FlhB [Gammaproteobacteria bacterium]
MAEEDTGQERTEQATPRRLERAREEGQVPRSRELNTAAILLAGSASLLMFGQWLATRILDIGRASFALNREEIFDTGYMAIHLGNALERALGMITPIFLLLAVAALLAPAVLGGWLFSAKAMVPKLERLSPLKGLARMFSVRSLVELLKAVAKVLLVGSIAVLLLWLLRADLDSMAVQPLEPALRHSLRVLGWSALALSASTLLIAAVDVPFQIFDHARKLRMSTQQIRDEMKETEGKPEIKSRIRQLQRQLARSRMMSAVPKADVVITNPSHYAVALRYDLERGGAPTLLAKGSDLVAFRIREVAEANAVAVVRSPKLARAIFFTTEIDAEIPGGLYLAVAQVLAYVYHLRNFRRGRGAPPTLPEELEVPEGMDVPRRGRK